MDPELLHFLECKLVIRLDNRIKPQLQPIAVWSKEQEPCRVEDLPDESPAFPGFVSSEHRPSPVLLVCDVYAANQGTDGGVR